MLKFFFFIVLLGEGLPRRLTARARRGLERFEAFRTRERLDALKALHPFLKPILAYFLGSPGLGTQVPRETEFI